MTRYESKQARRHAYYMRNRERIIGKAKEWHRAHYVPRALLSEEDLQLVRAYDAAYRMEHRERINEQHCNNYKKRKQHETTRHQPHRTGA